MLNKKETDRRQKMLTMRKDNYSYNSIGSKFGVSGERVRQIINNTGQAVKVNVEKHSLATRDVAQLLCIHPNTVRRWADVGILQSYRIGSRRDRRFRREDIESLRIKTE